MPTYFGYQKFKSNSAIIYRSDGFALFINNINYQLDSLQGYNPMFYFFRVERNIDILRELLKQGAI